jgi:hypothetical protein
MALYVAGYSAFRLLEENLRIDYSVHILGMRLNFWIALLVCLAGLAWFVWIQRRGKTEPLPLDWPRAPERGTRSWGGAARGIRGANTPSSPRPVVPTSYGKKRASGARPPSRSGGSRRR